jgi:hypothetical protein
MMGTFGDGITMALENSTIVEDPIAFGEEWQVLPLEPKLFRNLEGSAVQ